MAWFRLHEGTYADPKWPIIARKSCTNVGTVVSIWIALLDHASQNEERGSLDGFDPETIDALYGYDDGTCQSVIEAMASKGIIVDGRLANWEKRQPVKEDATASERKQRYNERKRNAPERSGTQAERSGTPENAPDKIREEEIKNININPPYPPGGNDAGDGEPAKPDHTHGNSKAQLQAAIREYTKDPALLAALEDFRQMRERLRKPLTLAALKLTLRELDKLGATDSHKVAIVEQSIQRGWQGVFPLKEQTAIPPCNPPQTDGETAAMRTLANYKRLKERGLVA